MEKILLILIMAGGVIALVGLLTSNEKYKD